MLHYNSSLHTVSDSVCGVLTTHRVCLGDVACLSPGLLQHPSVCRHHYRQHLHQLQPDGCVHHNHSALSHDVIIFVSNVIGDTGQQIGVTTESESTDDTGQQVGVVSVMKFSVPDSLFKFRDEGSHANHLNQPTAHRQVSKIEPTVDDWYVGDSGSTAGLTNTTKVHTESSNPDSLNILRDEGFKTNFQWFLVHLLYNVYRVT